MATIQELPIHERPRERAYQYGVEKLSNVELLAILIRSGYRDMTAMDIAYNLLKSKNGLFDLVNSSYKELTQYKGIKDIKAITIAAAFELGKRYEVLKNDNKKVAIDNEYVFNHLSPYLKGLDKERFIMIALNKRSKIISEEVLFEGQDDNVSFSFKILLSKLLISKAHSFYIVHNHPGDTMEPSDADVALTAMIMTETRNLGFKMKDHLIITSIGYYSILQNKAFYKR